MELTFEQKINRVNWFINNQPEMSEYVAGTKIDKRQLKLKSNKEIGPPESFTG